MYPVSVLVTTAGGRIVSVNAGLCVSCEQPSSDTIKDVRESVRPNVRAILRYSNGRQEAIRDCPEEWQAKVDRAIADLMSRTAFDLAQAFLQHRAAS